MACHVYLAYLGDIDLAPRRRTHASYQICVVVCIRWASISRGFRPMTESEECDPRVRRNQALSYVPILLNQYIIYITCMYTMQYQTHACDVWT